MPGAYPCQVKPVTSGARPGSPFRRRRTGTAPLLGELGEEGEVGAGAVERGAQRISAAGLKLHPPRVWTTVARRDLLSTARSGASPTASGSFRISGKAESARLPAIWTSPRRAESATPITRTGFRPQEALRPEVSVGPRTEFQRFRFPDLPL